MFHFFKKNNVIKTLIKVRKKRNSDPGMRRHKMLKNSPWHEIILLVHSYQLLGPAHLFWAWLYSSTFPQHQATNLSKPTTASLDSQARNHIQKGNWYWIKAIWNESPSQLTKMSKVLHFLIVCRAESQNKGKKVKTCIFWELTPLCLSHSAYLALDSTISIEIFPFLKLANL